VLVPIGAVSQGLALIFWEVLPLGLLVGGVIRPCLTSLEMVALRNIATQAFSVTVSLEQRLLHWLGICYLVSTELLQWLHPVVFIRSQ